MDKLTPEQRRKCMQSNKSKGTRPELLLAKYLWRLGLRYRKNSKYVFGKPDFSFKKHKTAVFIDGEFWHGKDWESRKADIKSNMAFWIAKIERNMQRDIEVNTHLEADGWQVLRFWAKMYSKIRNLSPMKYTDQYMEYKTDLKTADSRAQKLKEKAAQYRLFDDTDSFQAACKPAFTFITIGNN